MTSDPVERFLRRVETHQRRAGLRPLAPGEAVDQAMRVLQSIAPQVLTATALPNVVATAAIGFILRVLLPKVFILGRGGSWVDPALAVAAALVVGLPLVIFGLGVAGGETAVLAAQALNPPMRYNVRRRKLFWLTFRWLLLASVAFVLAGAIMAGGGYMAGVSPEDSFWPGLVAFFGTLGLPVGGLLFLGSVARHVLALPVMVIEGTPVSLAMTRGRSLMRGIGRQPSADGQAVNGLLLAGFVALVLVGGILLVDGVLGGSAWITELLGIGLFSTVFGQLLSFVPLWAFFQLAVPAWVTYGVVMYFDRRVRIEGYDISAMGQALGGRSGG